MDKQRAEFEKRYAEHFHTRIPDSWWSKVLQKYIHPDVQREFSVWQAAQAAMQPKIDKLLHENNKFMWQVRDTCTRAEKADQQLTAANQRNKELEATLNQVRSTYNQIIAEDTATRNEYLDEIAKLEERIRVADAEEPVARVTHTLLGFNVSYLKTLRGVTTLYAHAQIPAEVELKANEVVKEQP